MVLYQSFLLLKKLGGVLAIKQELPINEQIRADKVQLIDENNQKIGIVDLDKALEIAYDKKLDLGYFFIILSSFSIIFQFVILIWFFKNSNNFSDRPIRRIIYSKNIREIKRTEL